MSPTSPDATAPAAPITDALVATVLRLVAEVRETAAGLHAEAPSRSVLLRATSEIFAELETGAVTQARGSSMRRQLQFLAFAAAWPGEFGVLDDSDA